MRIRVTSLLERAGMKISDRCEGLEIRPVHSGFAFATVPPFTRIAHQVRIKITKPLHGSIDGIQLARFTTGLMYDVGTTLGNYLLSMGTAIPIDDDTPALVVPIDDVATKPMTGAVACRVNPNDEGQ